METLSKQQVEFIDHYLEYSGIQFPDVRLELTDHVASEVERKINERKVDFRTAFKNYMAAHKRELIKSERSFMWAMDKKILLSTLKNFRRPLVLLLSVVLFFGYRQLDFLDLVDAKGIWLKVCLVYSLLIFVCLSIAKHRKFLGLQRVTIYCNWLLFFPMLFVKPRLIFLSLGDQVFMAIMILVNISLFYTAIKMHRTYRNNYQLS